MQQNTTTHHRVQTPHVTHGPIKQPILPSSPTKQQAKSNRNQPTIQPAKAIARHPTTAHHTTPHDTTPHPMTPQHATTHLITALALGTRWQPPFRSSLERLEELERKKTGGYPDPWAQWVGGAKRATWTPATVLWGPYLIIQKTHFRPQILQQQKICSPDVLATF